MSIRHMIVTVDGVAYEVSVEILDEGDGPLRLPAVKAGAAPAAKAPAAPAPAAAPPAAPAAAGGGSPVTAPLGGTVIKIHVSAGQAVQAGQALVTLEAMKMNTDITAASAGTVQRVLVNEGASVSEGAVLVELA
ncbi:MAG: biotin/lipoyl-binding protein [Planctomycetota bacterium]|nr:MAG: biotin/lipoyl-binding protein [Planctomycetota bacterium]